MLLSRTSRRCIEGLLLGGLTASLLWAWSGRGREHLQDPEMTLLYEPGPPVAIHSMVTELAPAACLVLAMPEETVLGNVQKMQCFIQLVEAASACTRVVILVNRDEPDAIPRITAEIRRRGIIPDQSLKNISFQRALIDSEWVRDYGPVFALGKDRSLVLLDNMYRDLRSEAGTERTLGEAGLIKTAYAEAAGQRTGHGPSLLDNFGHFWRRNDDAAPLYFNEIIHAEKRRFAPLVRTPLQLPGGDVCFTGDGTMITSTRTFEINGGDGLRFSRTVRDYFGIGRICYLRPLPRGMWHIDMIIRQGLDQCFMIGSLDQEASPVAGTGPDLVRKEAAETLEWNFTQVQHFFPAARIIRVPMPPPLQQEVPTPAAPTGSLEERTVNGATLRLKPLSPVFYRSYLNSVFINGANGGVVLVPRFRGLEFMEKDVEQCYRQAYPGVGIRFIPADVLVEDFAGLHCVTAVIPKLD